MKTRFVPTATTTRKAESRKGLYLYRIRFEVSFGDYTEIGHVVLAATTAAQARHLADSVSLPQAATTVTFGWVRRVGKVTLNQ